MFPEKIWRIDDFKLIDWLSFHKFDNDKAKKFLSMLKLIKFDVCLFENLEFNHISINNTI